ncbi:MAG TPA: hypothetical protein VJT14_10000 [Candidatus Dormibacteraeota bacterium]|nr:hypothetical protein [Candidatus Dormibacteraeota bacterium]
MIEEAERISAAASAGKIPAKLVGGAAVNLHCSSARQAPLKRKYGDLDFVASSKQRQAVQKLFESLGYQGDRRFNTLNGDQRLLYLDGVNGRQIDVFIDRMKMCHVIELANRLGHEGPTLTPADLLISKLQVYEVNMKDLVDTTALLLDHPVADHDDDAINAAYLARLTSEDWGLHRTLQLNSGRVREAVRKLDVDAGLVNQRLDELWTRIDAQPKSLRWRLRARVGDRMSWYELPEEVRQPYQAE